MTGCTTKLCGVLATALLVAPTAMLAVQKRADAGQIQLDVKMAQPILLAQKKQTTFLKVGLTGFKLARKGDRAPVNVAFVLDKSGSMSGQKIERAKQAAISALERLSANDIVSVVTYDSTVNVLVPATKLSNIGQIREKIQAIKASGSTAFDLTPVTSTSDYERIHPGQSPERIF
jgi:Ca-activated chloride channel family protein